MADIVNFSTRQHVTHPDKVLLEVVASWRVARAQTRLAWAQHDKRSLFDTQSVEISPPHEAIETMVEAEEYFKACAPITTLGARVMLDVVLDIQAARQIDPKSLCAQGPTLEMLANISRALEMDDAPNETRFGRNPRA